MPLAFESHSSTPAKALENSQTPFIRVYCRACLPFPFGPRMHSRIRDRMHSEELAFEIGQPFDRKFSNAFEKHIFENLRSNGCKLTRYFNATIDFWQDLRAHLKKRASHQGGILIPRTCWHNTESASISIPSFLSSRSFSTPSGACSRKRLNTI